MDAVCFVFSKHKLNLYCNCLSFFFLATFRIVKHCRHLTTKHHMIPMKMRIPPFPIKEKKRAFDSHRFLWGVDEESWLTRWALRYNVNHIVLFKRKEGSWRFNQKTMSYYVYMVVDLKVLVGNVVDDGFHVIDGWFGASFFGSWRKYFFFRECFWRKKKVK